jgi:hypothetical protein
VTYMHRFPVKTVPLPSAWVEFFQSVVFVYSLCFSSHNLSLYYSIFNGISIGMKLDRPYFIFRLNVIVKRG